VSFESIFLMEEEKHFDRSSSQNYGWFVAEPDHKQDYGASGPIEFESSEEPLRKALSLPTPVTDPPVYVLESTLDSQQLWYLTAGTRPRQPAEERKFYEQQWQKNFAESEVMYTSEILRSEEPKENLISLMNEFGEEVLYRGKGPFSNAVSKSFMDHCVSSLTIQIPRFKIVKNIAKREEFHAEFLVTIALGSVTHGVWKRHSQFKELFDQILLLSHRGRKSSFKNSILSWQCVLNRQKWFRCLDKVCFPPSPSSKCSQEYISLKCFLLERFMHDVLFESGSPDLIVAFLGLSFPNQNPKKGQ
jgi:hypothetical protein